MSKISLEKDDIIDHDKWSRQIRTYGIEITKILSNLKILLVGLKGYGIEIAKNIVLSNPNQLSIFDDEILILLLHSPDFFPCLRRNRP